MNRYARQINLTQVGKEGQEKISSARVAIVGLGALGSVSAQLCARAGIGFLKLIDRDVVEWTNLQRQGLFTEEDACLGRAKATASVDYLSKVNSEIRIEPVIEDLRFENIEELLGSADVILDGTDNYETRYLINDFAVQRRIAYIYGGAVETRGMVYAVLPDGRPCLRCFFPQSDSSQTCDLNGVLASAAHWTASLQFTQMMQFLVRGASGIQRRVVQYDIWRDDMKYVPAESLGGEQCSGCREGRFAALQHQTGTQTLKLCGRNAVQIQPEKAQAGRSWETLSARLKDHAQVSVGIDFARVALDPYELTVFKNGRVIVKGTEDPAVARGLYAKWFGC